MNEKQQQLTFDKGMTNIPSDAICSDNELEECLNMYYADGEHHPIQSPVEFMNGLTGKVLFVHKLASGEHFIYRTPIADNDQTVYSLKWRTKDDATEHDVINNYGIEPNVQITAIGKTLIVNIPNEEIKYFLWKPNNGEYYNLGTIPNVTLSFRLIAPNLPWDSGNASDNFMENRYERGLPFDSIPWAITEENRETVNDAFLGYYARMVKSISSKGYFTKPFVLRYAVRLYDGTYTYTSAPIMLFPAITKNVMAAQCKADNGTRTHLFVSFCALQYTGTYDYSDWSDIVDDVVVFASDGVEIYDTSGDHLMSVADENTIAWNSISSDDGSDGIAFQTKLFKDITEHCFSDLEGFENRYVMPFNAPNEEDILKSLKETSLFYKIAELGLVMEQSNWIDLKAPGYVLNNLSSQEQMPDDYYSHCPMSSNFMSTYNNRLLLADVKRGFFEGFTSFMPYTQNEEHPTTRRTIKILVWIKTNEGDRIVSNRFSTEDIIDKYFFYPDPRAYKAQIYIAGSEWPAVLDYFVREIELKEHPFLNGAYYFGGLPDGTESMDTEGTMSTPPADVKTPENLYNQVFNSEVNNPFVFKAEGNITVGNGKILALSSITQALSQGQFGQYPLIIFTDEGIFAASIDNTGVIKAVHPMSREVLNNVRSVTLTDGAVFFSSAKGLMVVVGNEVKCVSEQMNGICSGVIFGSFQSYLKNAFIAYDYRDSLLWIMNGTSICYLYSIRSGTFSHYHFPVPINNVVNYYPDFLLQDTGQQTSKLYSLMERTPIADDIISTYEGFFTTRPMKFENALALKSIMQIIHIKQIESGTVTMRIFASNNLDKDSTTWVELHSLRGEPWKYYKFRFDFANWKATDTFAGSVVVTQERRIEKLR